MRIVIAIGGNALIRAGEDGTWERQLRNAGPIAREIVAMRAAGHELVLTHGNGPQVGALMLQQHLARAEVPEMPLDALTAMTQGQLGYLLQTAIARVDPSVPTAALLTRVEVDAHEPAFEDPTKPVGPFYGEEQALLLAAERGWSVASDSGRGWRRVVPSPRPRAIVDAEHVAALLARGVVVVAAGGGGIPVGRSEGEVVGLPGVIDKDRASAELAIAIGADTLVLLTGVRRVAVDFGTRWQREMARITVSDAMRALAEGEFPAGSMGPKIESAERFVGVAQGRAVITSANGLHDAVSGGDGTWIVPDHEGPSVFAQSAVPA
jgi:carbamate kinase